MFDTTDELLRQIRLGEDSTLELKNLLYRGDQVSAPHRDSMADELAAMANTMTGVFVLGVDDKTKNIVGVPEDKLDAVETWIRCICNDIINPQLICMIRKIPTTGADGAERILVRVDVPKSLFVHQSPGGYFNRIGSSKRPMQPEVLARLFQQRSQARIIRFDEQSVSYAPIECIQQSLWGKFIPSTFTGSKNEFLLKLKLLTKDDEGKFRPSVSGILMACPHPEEYMSNAFIQAVCYRGIERNAAYQLDARDITGSLDVQIQEALAFVQRNMKIYAVKEPERRDIPQYAIQAVFEAIVNAVAHRDYSIKSSKIRLHMFSDRLELFSPGTIPNTMSIDSLPLLQSSRNELLTSLLAKCYMPDDVPGVRKTLMDKRGEGVPIILAESEKISGIKPLYQLIDDSELMLTIYAANPKAQE